VVARSGRPAWRRWWLLWRPPVTGVAFVLLLAVGAGGVLGQWRLWRVTVEETDSQDFGIFFESVHHFAEGRSLYAPLPPRRQPPYWSGQLNLNLPHTNLFMLPLALLPVGTALRVWVLASLAVLGWSTWASLGALGWRLPLLGWLGLGVYLVTWGPAASFSLTVQLCFLLMGPVTAGWLAARRGQRATAGAWLGLAAAIKPFLLVFAPFLALRRDYRGLSAFLLVATLLVAVGVAVFGPGAYAEWLAQLPRVTWGSHYMNASLAAVAERALGRSAYGTFGVHPWLKIGLLGAALAAVAVATLRAATRTGSGAPSVDRAWAVLLLASLLLSPLGWVYYLWIALWPVAAVVGHARPWRRVRSRDLLLIPGLLGWLWFRRMASWGQPAALASVTAASMYCWALVALWAWTGREAVLDSADARADTGADRLA
jgi:Glycosyltransferase family 87